MKFKTIISIICITSLMLTLGLSTVSASSEITLTVSEVTASPGTDIEVPVILSGNTMGVCAMMLAISYDNRLVLTGVERGDALASLDMTKSKSLTENPYKIMLESTDADTTNGTIYVLTFTVPLDATGKLDISLSYDAGDIYDYDMNDINTKIVNGGITVESSTTEPTLTLSNLVKSTNNISLDVDLTSPTDIEGKVVVALYDKNGLVKTKIYDATKTTIDVSLDVVNGDYIKAFWWDFDTFFPFTDCVKIEL